MKKLFLIAAVALGLGAMTSCNGSCESNAGAAQKDSLAAALGEMYVDSERFRQNIDQECGEGTAVFSRDAIRIYCGTTKK